MLTILLFIDCSKIVQIRINTRTHTKEKPYLINLYFFFSKLVRQNKSIGWAKYMYVYEWDMCWRNFSNFPWWLNNVKSRSKIALFSNEHHFEIWFPKKKTIPFFWSKLSKLLKKRSNFACDNYIFPKTRGNKNKQYTHSTPLKAINEINSQCVQDELNSDVTFNFLYQLC